ncbi:MAG: T9SS type A sorting domain-containing protein [Bacteroidia bacterium]
MKRHILLLFLALVFTKQAYTQTYFINGVTANGNFDAPSSVATWATANGTTNLWEIGTFAPTNSGTKSAYIRTFPGGTNNSYTNTITHKNYLYSVAAYTIPATANCAYVTFWYKGRGEAAKDFMTAYLTTALPTAGAVPPAGATRIGATEYGLTPSNGTVWVQATIQIPPSLFGVAQRLMFYWQNDASGGSAPAIKIDDVQFYYNTTGPTNDDCVGATVLPVGGLGICNITNDNVACASNSGIVAPTGTADDDVWYSFVATNTSQIINTTSAINPVIEVFSGACGSLTSIANANATSLNVGGLTIGTTYYVRIYSFAAVKPALGTFTICITSPGVCPTNLGLGDTTIASLPFTVSAQSTCGKADNIKSTNVANVCGSATYYSGEDVVYNFTPTLTGSININLTTTIGTRTGLMLYQGCPFTGTCVANAQSTTGNKTLSCINVTAGVTYYLVIDSDGGTILCNPYDLTITAPVSNDNCSEAIVLPASPSTTCTTTSGDIACATNSGIVAPTGTADDDLWYSFLATSTSHIVNVASGINPVIEVFSGTCGALVSLGSANASTYTTPALVIGTTYYVRVYSFAAVKPVPGAFTICITTPATCPADLGIGNVNIASLPYSIAAQTTCSLGNDITSVNAKTCGSTSYFGGEDVVYTFTPTTTGNISITLTSTIANSAFMLYQGCPFTGTCITNAQDAALVKTISCIPVTAGVTYYLVIDSRVSNPCGFYALNITAPVAAPSVSNDNCAGAIALTAGAFLTCTEEVGDITCATNSAVVSPSGVPDDDLWYSFVATNTVHIVNVTSAINPVIQVFSGTCGALVSLAFTNSGSLVVGGLTIGTTYRFRVYSFAAVKPVPGAFSVCVTSPDPAAVNEPCGAVEMFLNPTCDNTDLYFNEVFIDMVQRSIYDASCSAGGNETNEKVLWVKFTATATSITITNNTKYSGNTYSTGSQGANDASVDKKDFALYTGACNALTPFWCSANVAGSGGSPASPVLTVGTTYYLMVSRSDVSLGVTPTCPTCNTLDLCLKSTASTLVANTCDACATACTATTNLTAIGTNANATPDAFMCTAIGSVDNNVWYKWCAPSTWPVGQSAFLNLSNITCSAAGGLQLTVFNNGVCPTSAPAPAATKICQGAGSIAPFYNSWVAKADSCYLITIDGRSGVICNYSITIGDVVLLPINLLDFTASAKLNYNTVEWITASETNNNYFEVESSDDAVSFKTIRNVKGAGNSTTNLKYSIRDENYYPTTYYRLKQVDYDGNFTYSEVRDVNRTETYKETPFTINIMPNPTNGEVNIRLINGTKDIYTVVVYSVEGKLLMKMELQEHEFNKGIVLDLSVIENGLYNIEVYSTKGTVVKKVIKFN